MAKIDEIGRLQFRERRIERRQWCGTQNLGKERRIVTRYGGVEWHGGRFVAQGIDEGPASDLAGNEPAPFSLGVGAGHGANGDAKAASQLPMGRQPRTRIQQTGPDILG